MSLLREVKKTETASVAGKDGDSYEGLYHMFQMKANGHNLLFTSVTVNFPLCMVLTSAEIFFLIAVL